MQGNPNYRFSKEELDWMAAHSDQVRDWARGDRVIVWTLVATFLLGLMLYLVGFGLGSGGLGLPDGWPTDLLADLLVSLGVVLWTSVILAVFLEILPRWQQRQAQAWSRAALIALRDRGDVPAAVVEAVADPVEAKLDQVLERMAALEAAIGAAQKPTA
jgi:hypothetical protein